MSTPDVIVYPGQPAPTGDTPAAHVAVTIDGRDVTCDALGELSIRGGRSDKMAQADAATMSLSLDWDPADPIPQLGQQIRVSGWLPHLARGHADNAEYALFHGTITDVAVEDLTVSVVAADMSRQLDGVYIGDTPWPEESTFDRLGHVITAIRAAMHNPPWLTHDPLAVGDSGIARVKPWMEYVCRRDVDRQPARQMLEYFLQPGLGSYYYRPSATTVTPGQQFVGDLQLVTGTSPTGLSTSSVNRYLCCQLVTADPHPRYWINYESIINSWKVTGKQWHGQDLDDVEAVATDAASVAANGYRAAAMSTDLVLDAGGRNYPQEIADYLLPRTKDPHWCMDSVTVDLRASTIRADPLGAVGGIVSHARTAWSVLDRGPSCHGRTVLVDIHGAHTFGQGQWGVQEQTQVDWDPDGWIITLALSHPLQYGPFTAPALDPTPP